MPHSTLEERASLFEPQCHPKVNSAVEHVDGFFLQHWPFENDRARRKFVAAGFSRVTCLYFPKSRDDRIELVCSLLTVLFLIDDQLEELSLRDGESFNTKLMPLCRGSSQPDRTVPAEWIISDIFADMRKCDVQLANDVLEPLFVFMRAQTSRERLSIKTLGHYLTYRQGDVGQALLASLTRFSMGLSLPAESLESVAAIEQNCGRHISIVNDIFSFEKEVKAAQEQHAEGGVLCNAVRVLAEEIFVNDSSAKHILWDMVREWEVKHARLVKERVALPSCGETLKAYLKGLEYHMSGNEAWSRTTERYRESGLATD